MKVEVEKNCKEGNLIKGRNPKAATDYFGIMKLIIKSHLLCNSIYNKYPEYLNLWI